MASAGDRGVIPFVADSESLILSSKTIFSFRVERLSRKTVQTSDATRQGNYELFARLLRKYKGPLTEGEGQAFTASPLIYAGPIRDRPLGLWAVVSQADLPKAGSIWVAFCAAEAGQATAVEFLKGAGSACRLAGQDAALDLELAIQAEQTQDLDHAIDLLAQNRQKDTSYYVEYLFSRYRSTLESNEHRPLLFSLIEGSRASWTLRRALVSGISDALSSGKELPLQVQTGFARSLVHAVFLERDSQERENILSIDLRNCIEAVAGRMLPTSEVFSVPIIWKRRPNFRQSLLA